VSPRGATITRFQVGDIPVLYPRAVKYIAGVPYIRGGLHMCAPWMGPQPHLPQHGIVRDMTFSKVVAHSDTHLQLIADCPDPQLYYPFPFSVSVSIYTGSKTLSTKLWMRNNSSSAMPVAPGIHPYYSMPKGTAVLQMGSQRIEVGGSSYEWGKPMLYEVPKDLLITIPGLGKISVPKGTSEYCVVWSDCPDYLAVSMVASNPSSYNTPSGQFLPAGNDFSLELPMEFYPEL